MKVFLIILADVSAADLLSQQRPIADSRLYEIFVILGALTVSVIIATIWAILYSRRKKRRKHRHHHSHSQRSETGAAEKSEQSEAPGQSRSRRKWKRMRRPHRPLNPTLAQTGGLPPLRGENDPLPPMP